MATDLAVDHEENDCTFLAFEELLQGVGQAQEPPYAVSSIGHASRKTTGSAEPPTPTDCDDQPTARAKGDADGDTRGETNGRSSISPKSNSSATEERGREHSSLTTPR